MTAMQCHAKRHATFWVKTKGSVHWCRIKKNVVESCLKAAALCCVHHKTKKTPELRFRLLCQKILCLKKYTLSSAYWTDEHK